MAKRRMFSMDIIDTDLFLEMPATTQLLYFHLSMRADDDGFVSAPKRILRLTGASEGDLRTLFERDFVIPFQSGICVIKHWKIHNYIQSDRYHKSIYTQEKLMLKQDTNGVYTMDTKCLQNGYRTDTEVRLGKASLGNVSEVKASLESIGDDEKQEQEKQDYTSIINHLNQQAGKNYKVTDSTSRLIHARIAEGFTFNDFFTVIDKKCAQWKGTDMDKYLRPSTLFNASKFEGYLNEKVIEKKHAGSKEAFAVDVSKYDTL